MHVKNLKRKITIRGSTVITVSIIIGIIVSFNTSEQSEIQFTQQTKADVVMPTKVSRPGCEEIDKCYIPSKISITKGESITWINEDAAFHSVTSGFYDSPDSLFDSGYLDPYESFSFTFNDVGNYDYFCTLHPWMKGQVIVE